MGRIRSTQLLLEECIRAVQTPEDGAIVSFVGQVRNHNEGLSVLKLEYHAYIEMAEAELAKILLELRTRFQTVHMEATHRIGMLTVGDIAVVAVTSSAHRGEAFEACHTLIDQIKERLPIWKREHGPEGPYWVHWKDARCHGHHE